MADAASGFDELAKLTADGATFLKNGDGSSPEISSAGTIVYEVSTYDSKGNVTGSELLFKATFTASPRVAYHTKDDISELAWGPPGGLDSGGMEPYRNENARLGARRKGNWHMVT